MSPDLHPIYADPCLATTDNAQHEIDLGIRLSLYN